MSTKLLLRSFAGGEITSELGGRVDLTKYNTGLSLCRNFITLPHGPAARRPGFQFVNEAKDSTKKVRLIPFAFSASQTAILEFGHQYIRFHINGGTLLEATVAVSSIAGSTVNTGTAHGYSTGDWVYIGSRFHKITVVDSDTFTTKDLWGANTTASGSTAARVYTLASPYVEADLFDLHYTQSADVVTIVHPSYAVRELRRYASANWELATVSFAAPSDVPTGVTATATIPQNTRLTTCSYVVTAVKNDGVTESLPSAVATVNNNLSLDGNYNTISWTGVDGYDRYNVYKLRGGVYGYIGQVKPSGSSAKTITSATPYDLKSIWTSTYKRVRVVTSSAHGYSTGTWVLIAGAGSQFNGLYQVTVENSTTFTYAKQTSFAFPASTGTASTPGLSIVDDNVLPDGTQTPPEDIIALNANEGDYPGAVAYYEQRRWFAGTNLKPQVVWATRNGTETNLTSSVPARAADGLEVRVASMQNNQIRHLLPLTDMIALTGGGEFRIYADNAPAITPTSITIKPQGYGGASNVQPMLTSGSILYVQAQGSRVRELAFGGEASNYGYKSIDASIMAPHRFDGYLITQLAYARAPDSILWAVRDDGVLLGLTYLPEQQVFAWHAHDTDGEIESVAVVAEDNEDVAYVVVKRTVNARTVRYVERLRTRFFETQENAFFVDSGLTYSGSPVTTLSGLWHLEGKQVDILADGAVLPRATVTGGAITIETAASTISVGLPITADLRTLPLTLEGAQAAGQGTVKNVNKVYLRVSQSSIVKAGPAFDRLREYPARAVTDDYGDAPALRTGELALSVDPSWNQDAAVCVRQDLPLPLTVLSMTLDVQVGG